MNHIMPCLWFDSQAEEAATFYVSIFKNSKMGPTTYYGEAGAQGSVMTVSFELDGQEFVALNGGPLFTFPEAISGHAGNLDDVQTRSCGDQTSL